jgi:polar amino acid transport system permease protein
LSVYIAILSGEIFSEEMRKLKETYGNAADVLGLKRSYFIKKIIFPAASLNVLPRMLNLGIVSIHMTMFASLIGVEELFRVSLRLNAEYLQPIEIFTFMALLYAAICLPLYFLAFVISKKTKEDAACLR